MFNAHEASQAKGKRLKHTGGSKVFLIGRPISLPRRFLARLVPLDIQQIKRQRRETSGGNAEPRPYARRKEKIK